MNTGQNPLIGRVGTAALTALLCGALGACGAKQETPPAPKPSSGPPTVTLSPEQLQVISVAKLATQAFPVQAESVGNIDFDQDRTVQVFTPYQGRIIQAFAQLGDNVRKGQPLYTVESPDLLAADATLISAEATEQANRKALDRAKKLQATQGISQQNVEAAISAEAGSNAALMSARAAMVVFGKSVGEIDAVARRGRADPVLVVRSPIGGKVTARNAQPGLLVQPGNAPAPYTVGDTSTMWMVADAPETDAAQFRDGQQVQASVAALPGRVLTGKILAVGAGVDPNAHTVQLRAAIANPGNLLKAGMQATFVIATGTVQHGVGIPADGVVREGDGSMTVWVATGANHFQQRVVTIGMLRNGFVQVLSGLNPGDEVVTKGALYLDNMLSAPPDD
jgi:cobalt-zinc-cadmium efflux system membrane fusion protein